MRFLTTGHFEMKSKNIKRDVMTFAWKIARKQAKKDNCTVKECFSWALKTAWDFLHMICTFGYGFREEFPKDGAFIRNSSFYASIAEEFPNVCKPVRAIQDDDTREILYCGSLKQCEDFRWDNDLWYKHFGYVEHSSYISGFLTPILWTLRKGGVE